MSTHLEENKNKNQGIIRINLTFTHRVCMLVCYVLQIVLFALFNLKMGHYIFMPMPFLFSSPSLIESPYTKSAHGFNAILYGSFFIQHIVMAFIIFKVSAQKVWYKYVLYQRYIYNISSSLTYLAILEYAQPVSDKTTILFTTPFAINIIFTVISTIFLVLAILRLGGDIFNPFPIKSIIRGQYIEFPKYTNSLNKGLVSSGLYGYCRHPMQSSVITLLIFAHNIYTIDRLIFIIVNCLGIFVGVYYEEKRLRIKFKGYKDYQTKVPYKFFPYII